MTNTPFVCVGGAGAVTEAGVCACMHMCNFTHINIGRQEEKGQIEPVQRVRRRAHMTMKL